MNQFKNKNLHDKILEKPFGDKEFDFQTLFNKPFIDMILLVTKICKNMKKSLMLLLDKILLRKKSLIETVNYELKNNCQIEHTRHRSRKNFLTSLLSGQITCSFLVKKPGLNLEEIIETQQICNFT